MQFFIIFYLSMYSIARYWTREVIYLNNPFSYRLCVMEIMLIYFYEHTKLDALSYSPSFVSLGGYLIF